MILPIWLRQLTSRWPARSAAVRPRVGRERDPRRWVRPRLEALEERLTPSTDLVFTTAAQTLSAGQASSVVTVQLQDGSGNPVLAPNGGTTVALSSSSATGEFLDTSGNPLANIPGGSGPSVFIAAGASSASFEYVDTNAGNPTLTASALFVTSGTQTETINLPSGNVIHVTTTADNGTNTNPTAGSLRAAIKSADAAPGSTIVFDAGVVGTIDLHGAALPPIDARMNIFGPGAGLLTITNGQLEVNVAANSPASVQITDLTFSDPGTYALADTNGNLTLRRDVLTGSGGGLSTGINAQSSSLGNVLIDDCTVTGNGPPGPTGQASGIHATGGSLTIVNSSISDNFGIGVVGTSASNTPPSINVRYSIIENNADTGLANIGGQATLQNVIVSGNHGTGQMLTLLPSAAKGDPGGILNAGQGQMTITASTIAGNTTTSGGVAAGLDSEGGSVTLVNSTVSNNINNGTTSGARAGGGGIGIYGGTASLTSDTVSGNLAAQSSGMLFASGGGIDSDSSGTVTLYDTIVAGNTGSVSNRTDVAGAFRSLGHNLIGEANSQSSGFVSSDLVGTTASPIDARLGPLQDNGGPTPTQALLPGSPAILAGSSTNAPATDQRGVGRPTTGPIDIGAYEFTAAPALTFSRTALPLATLNVRYDQTITATGGTGNVTVSATLAPNNKVPAGLKLVASGNTLTISGTPTATGLAFFTLKATDSTGLTVTQTYALEVSATSPIFSPTTLPDAGTGRSYEQTITAAVTGNNSMTFQLAPGVQIPPGLTFTPGANQLVISGTPTAPGVVSFIATATDAAGATVSQAYQLNVLNTIGFSLASLPDGTIGGAYSQNITPSGGIGVSAVTYQVLSGIVPLGLTIRPTAVPTGDQISIFGTPTLAGTVTLQVTASDSANNTFTKIYTLTVNPAPTLAPGTLPAGTVGVGYDQTVTASGGSGDKAVTYHIASGSIPGGLTITPGTNALRIQGTPTTSGVLGLEVTATDAAGGTATQNYVITITGTTVLPPGSLPSGTVGAFYSQTIHLGSGNTVPAVRITSGALPGGLSFQAGVNQLVVEGTPRGPGSVGFEVSATDSRGNTVRQDFSLTINGPVVLVPGGLPGGAAGSAYFQVLTASGGSGDKTVTSIVASGSLPGGLGISPGIDQLVISGTPSAGGSATIVVTATDAAGGVAQQSYQLTFSAASPSPPPPASATQVQQGQQDIFSMAVSVLTGNVALFFQSLGDYHALPADAQQQALQAVTSNLVQLVMSGQGDSDAVNTLFALDMALTFHLI